jgi:hypothetical protein
MSKQKFSFPDLIIEQCIPNCRQCSGVWIKDSIQHRIICRCKFCDHGQNKKAGLGSQPRHQPAAVTSHSKPLPCDYDK